MWAEGGHWELAGGMSTPSVLTVNQSPAPAPVLASPALTSQILFRGHKMGAAEPGAAQYDGHYPHGAAE